MTTWRSRLLSPCWSAVHTLIQKTLPTPADTGWFYCGDAESFPVHPSSVWHRVPPPSWLLHIPWKPPAHRTPPPLSLPCLSLSFRCTAAQHVSLIGWLNALSHHSAGMSFNCHSWFWILLCFYMALMLPSLLELQCSCHNQPEMRTLHLFCTLNFSEKLVQKVRSLEMSSLWCHRGRKIQIPTDTSPTLLTPPLVRCSPLPCSCPIALIWKAN